MRDCAEFHLGIRVPVGAQGIRDHIRRNFGEGNRAFACRYFHHGRARHLGSVAIYNYFADFAFSDDLVFKVFRNRLVFFQDAVSGIERLLHELHARVLCLLLHHCLQFLRRLWRGAVTRVIFSGKPHSPVCIQLIPERLEFIEPFILRLYRRMGQQQGGGKDSGKDKVAHENP